MTPHTLNGFSVLIPDIPEGATEFIGNVYAMSYMVGTKAHSFMLPNGFWQLFRLSEVPESLAGEMVETFTCYETMKSGYKNYAIWSHEDDLFDTAHASLTSWVRSKGVKGDPRLLIKKNN